MMSRAVRSFTLCVALAPMLLAAVPARSQQPSLREQLAGSWQFVLTAVQRKDGTRADVFGAHPNGLLMFHPDGYFTMINTRPGRPKYASGNRVQGTAEEFRDTVLGSLAYFGTYTVDEGRSAFVLKVWGSTFPDYEGGEQVRPFTIVGDELRSINPNPTQGGPALDLVLKRLPKTQ
jgi:hypothetical protein